MSVLWTSDEIVAATGGKATCAFDVTGLSIDTRTIKAGDLFVALKDQRDGHDFVHSALNSGAAGALVSHIPDGLAPDAPLIVVDDVLIALEAMARAARARVAGKVIAVTGSAGKTSTKDMLLSVLGWQGKTHGSEASYNNHWGVPLTLARMPRDTQYGVIEIGMNHPGEIEPLARLTAPDVAIVTTVAPAHLEAFADIREIAVEKASIFKGLVTGGVAIFNADLPVSDILRAGAGAQSVAFGEDPAADVCASSIRLHDGVSVVHTQTPDGPLLFKVMAPGRHFAVNALAVLAAVRAVGADSVLGATDLAKWTPPSGRGARETVLLDPVDDRMVIELIDDAYNANPASVAAGLEVLAAAQPRDGLGRVSNGRRIAILGDMLELGTEEAALHRAISELPAMEEIALVHCVGPRMRNLYDVLPAFKRGEWVVNADELKSRARSLVDAGDVVLVKGSKSSHVSRIVDAIRKLGHGAPTK